MALEQVDTTVDLNRGGLEDVIAFAQSGFSRGEFANATANGSGSVTVTYADQSAQISKVGDGYQIFGPESITNRFAELNGYEVVTRQQFGEEEIELQVRPIKY